MNWTWDGSHMTWAAAMATNDEARLPTIEEALTLGINEWVWTCEEFTEYPDYIAWSVHPGDGKVEKHDKSNMFAQVDVWPA